MKQHTIYYSEETINEMVISVEEILRSGWVICGKNVREYEDELARLTGREYAIATNSATAAFEMCMRAMRINHGSIVFPANGFAGIPLLTRRTNTQPLFCDIDIDAGISPRWDQIEDVLNDDVVAVCLMHIGGFLATESEKIETECKKRGLLLIEDCSHSIGAEINQRKGGSFGDMSVISNHATKVFGIGEGGGILTDDNELAERSLWLFTYGHKEKFGGQLIFEEGYSWRMTEFQAALGTCLYREADQILRDRETIAQYYHDLYIEHNLNKFGIHPVPVPPKCRPAWMQYILMLPERIDGGALKISLRNRGLILPKELFSPPVHKQPIWHELYRKQSFPQAEIFSEKQLNLPIWRDLTREEQEEIFDVLSSVLNSQEWEINVEK